MHHGVGSVAAIDCGTNSTRLLIADDHGRTIERSMVITRLGAGVDATGRLGADGIERTVATLTAFGERMERAGVRRARQVATSAVRDAANAEEFLVRATEATGVATEVLSGEEEGQLSFTGALSGLRPCEKGDVVVDIGGGSTEMILGRDGRVQAVSIDMGCVRVTERFLHHDPPLGREVADADAEIGRGLDRAVRALGLADGACFAGRMIGLAGTVSTLRAAELGLAVYDRDRIHHGVLEAGTVAAWADRLASEPASARSARPGIDAGRADVLVAGAMILRRTMERLGVETCLVSESDILDGLVASLRCAGSRGADGGGRAR